MFEEFCVGDFGSLERMPIGPNYEAMRLYFEQNGNDCRRPAPFSCLPEAWREEAGQDCVRRVYINKAEGLRVEVSDDLHLTQENHFTFRVSRLDGMEPSYAALKAVRLAFLGRCTVALLVSPFNETANVRVMYATLDGQRLPRFTATMEGVPV